MNGRVRLRFLGALLAMQFVTITAILVGSSLTLTPALIDQMDALLSNTAIGAANQANTQLMAPVDAAEYTADLLAADAIPGADARSQDEALALRFTERLDLHDEIAGMFYGRDDGSFVYVSRDDERGDGALRTKIITVEGDGRQVNAQWFDPNGNALGPPEPDPTDDYDPRSRPWYEAAVAEGEPIWTDTYVFFTSKEPGVTTAAPVPRDGGAYAGVVGVDLGLSQLAGVVDAIEVSANGEAIIVDDRGRVVAHGDTDQAVVTASDGTVQPAEVDDLSNPVVSNAFDQLVAAQKIGEQPGGQPPPGQTGQSTIVSFDIDGAKYQAVAEPLAAPDNWYVIVAAPETDFVGEILSSERTNALIAVAIGLGMVVLALPVVTLLARRVSRLQHHAHVDALTGLANRRAFDARLGNEFDRSHTSGRQLCTAQVDVDFFKDVNDTFGHAVGDQALATIASRLDHGIRKDDLVARTGGDEFAVLLVDTSEDEAGEILERIRHSIEDQPIEIADGRSVPVTVTIGVAELQDDDESTSALFERADQALYVAKEAGRNRVAAPTGVLTAGREVTGAPR